MNQLYRETLGLLAEASTATIQYQLFKPGRRNTYLFGLSALIPAVGRLVGEAFTLRYVPACEDVDGAEVSNDPDHPLRKSIESVGVGQDQVVECRRQGPRAASDGHTLMTRGTVATVTDASVRDSPEFSEMLFPVGAAGFPRG